MSNILASHIHPSNESFLLSLIFRNITSAISHQFNIYLHYLQHVCTVSDLWPDSPHHEVTLQSQQRIIRRSLSQSPGFLLARMFDVTHHPMSHITSAHNIPASNTILSRNIKSPPIYNTKPIFATLPPPQHKCALNKEQCGKTPNYLTGPPPH